MLQTLRGLYELQSIDAQIRDIDEQLAQLPAKLKELETRATDLSKMVEEISDERNQAHKEARNIEGQVQTESLKVRKWEQRLNDIRNQREYLALSREVEASKRQNRDLEDQIGELNKKRDEFDAQANDLLEQAATTEEEIKSEREQVTNKTQELEASKVQLESKREELLPTVDKGHLRKYDFIRGKRAGVGITTVVGGCCQACYMQLPPQLYNVLQRGDTFEQCPSCSRIIIWDKFLEAPESSEKTDAEEEGEAGEGVQATP
ncbi:MAG: C4-type zinc ribbon domain-containing protein [Myxococcota bacterium]